MATGKVKQEMLSGIRLGEGNAEGYRNAEGCWGEGEAGLSIRERKGISQRERSNQEAEHAQRGQQSKGCQGGFCRTNVYPWATVHSRIIKEG